MSRVGVTRMLGVFATAVGATIGALTVGVEGTADPETKESPMSEAGSSLGFPIWGQGQFVSHVLFAGPTGADVLGRLRGLRDHHIAQRPPEMGVDDSYGAGELVYMFSLDLPDRRVQAPRGFTPLLEVFGIEGRDHRALRRVARAAHVLVFVTSDPVDDEMLEEIRAAMRPERGSQVLRIGRTDDFAPALEKAIARIERDRWE